ncbi:MAG: 60S ribosomal subunit assembly/export protein [Vezdaea acicularis]|nr:MAG: 60S ribosomal subunit assembly/export protein [Vezdaea acicularis]
MPTIKVKPSKLGLGNRHSSAPSSDSKYKVSKSRLAGKVPRPKPHKAKVSLLAPKKKKRIYSDKELDVPKLNMITPVGVGKPKGKKKGKVFVDDQESMMTILSIVNADKEGQIESKMMKARQMEEIREARRREAEARQEDKRSKLEETKDSIRKKRKRKSTATEGESQESTSREIRPKKASGKRVSFA